MKLKLYSFSKLQKRGSILAALLLCIVSFGAYANNITVSNVQLLNQDQSNDLTTVQLDITWDNSWRVPANIAPRNYDAAWVFIKFKVANPGGMFNANPWQHAMIDTGGHTAPSGSTIDVPSDSMGVFIYRDSPGSGTFTATGVQLVWDYGASGVNDTNLVDVEVFAVEMVYIPKGPFWVGEESPNDVDPNFFFTLINTDTANIPVDSTDTIQQAGFPWSTHPFLNPVNPPNPNWPNGFNAFYMMKYEVSQDNYARFLNSVQPNGGTTGFFSNATANGHSITFSATSGLYTASVPDRSNNFMDWSDAANFADWSGLRPMSELEFEKACRPEPFHLTHPALGAYPWFSGTIYATVYTLGSAGTPTEIVTNPATTFPLNTGNALYTGTVGTLARPLRNGVFAASAMNPTAAETGGTYYGVMEMGGNVWEQVVNITTTAGATYTGTHGDGDITNGLPVTWPAAGTGVGAGRRGGGYPSAAKELEIATRSMATTAVTTRIGENGFRAVRTAP